MTFTIMCKICRKKFETNHIETHWNKKIKKIIYFCDKCKSKKPTTVTKGGVA